jgi:hypothetical protein
MGIVAAARNERFRRMSVQPDVSPEKFRALGRLYERHGFTHLSPDDLAMYKNLA